MGRTDGTRRGGSCHCLAAAAGSGGCDGEQPVYRKGGTENKRMVPFGWANIREGAEKAREDARLCLEEYGCAGVKLNGAQNEYYIDCPEAMSVMEVVAARNGMIAFHIGADYPDFTDPIRAERAARAFPDTKFLMVHMGGAGEPDVSQRVIETAARNPNMYLVGSAIPAAKVKAAIDTLGPDRILFGSDTPFYDAADVIREYDRMLSGYDEEVRRKSWERMPEGFLDFQCRACDVRRGGCRQTSIHPCSLCWENIFYLFFLPSFPFSPLFLPWPPFYRPFLISRISWVQTSLAYRLWGSRIFWIWRMSPFPRNRLRGQKVPPGRDSLPGCTL